MKCNPDNEECDWTTCSKHANENLTREFEKLLMMLQDKFPEAFEYYKKRLRPPMKKEQ